MAYRWRSRWLLAHVYGSRSISALACSCRRVQRIVSDFDIGDGAEVSFTTHCTFPNAVHVQHLMESSIRVGKGATMRYHETHYHGETGGTEVRPVASVIVERGGRYYSTFTLSHGRAGQVAFEYDVDVASDGVAELDARVMGYGDDEISSETIRLNGDGARAWPSHRGAGAGAQRGVRHHGGQRARTAGISIAWRSSGSAIANAVPVVRVTDPQAQVTHEAASARLTRKSWRRSSPWPHRGAL